MLQRLFRRYFTPLTRFVVGAAAIGALVVGGSVATAAPLAYHFLTQWGSFGSANGQFEYPQGIAVDPRGDVFVADTINHRIQKFTSAGTYLTQWGSYGSDNGQFGFLNGVACDQKGDVFVTEYYRIQEFDPSGIYLTQWGSVGTADGQFRDPQSVAVDQKGNVFVADTNNNRIEVFTRFDTGLKPGR